MPYRVRCCTCDAPVGASALNCDLNFLVGHRVEYHFTNGDGAKLQSRARESCCASALGVGVVAVAVAVVVVAIVTVAVVSAAVTITITITITITMNITFNITVTINITFNITVAAAVIVDCINDVVVAAV